MLDFLEFVYKFDDMPSRRLYVFKRIKNIFPDTSDKEINKVLDEIKIKFREQEERGASNHQTKTIYVPLKDAKKFKLNNKNDVLKYLENPKTPIVHEVMHIFQNLAGTFPNVQYAEKVNGKTKIDYDKYINDPGEKQARLEQVLELLNWGFTKSEIIEWLYNRAHNDKKMWSKLIDYAMDLKKKTSL
jgi:hypothetical protein